ncbi:hypothetical protein ACFSL6_26360 [Paenibacillus thailandensis]|uniref:Uncharacterized protein n=1 Tax=Paenibacillus thailandensis TaxID=393250 RepID=A0ABW5QR91_9BACL
MSTHNDRISRCRTAFQLWFTYRVLHKKRKLAAATGEFTCRINPHSQTIEYRMDMQSDIISRPYSESFSILFSNLYEEIPPQRVTFTEHPVFRLRYPVPIVYDWEAFILDGMKQAVQQKKLQALLRDYRLKGVNGQQIDGELRLVDFALKPDEGSLQDGQ